MISDWKRAWRARALLRPPIVQRPPQRSRLNDERLNEEEEWVRRHLVQTDLAVEAHEVIVEREGPPEIPGVRVEKENFTGGTITRVTIETDVGSRLMGKQKGHYSTLEAPVLREHNPPAHEQLAGVLAGEIGRFLDLLHIGPGDPVLLVGLGNWNATPDALGPQVIGHCLVTRHLFRYAAPEAQQGLRPVAAITPGVMGLTGMETSEIVAALVHHFRPSLVVCVDALAARTVERLGTTVQIADAGISPGSGVGNTRRGITATELGVPVLVLGVPTVISALSILSDAWDRVSGRTPHNEESPPPTTRIQPDARQILRNIAPSPADGQPGEAPNGAPPLKAVEPPAAMTGDQAARWAAKQETITSLLQPYLGTMVVTPKEVDVLIDDLAAVVAGAINVALHPGLNPEDAFDTLQ